MLQAQALDHLAQDAQRVHTRLTGLVRPPDWLQSELQAGSSILVQLEAMHVLWYPGRVLLHSTTEGCADLTQELSGTP